MDEIHNSEPSATVFQAALRVQGSLYRTQGWSVNIIKYFLKICGIAL